MNQARPLEGLFGWSVPDAASALPKLAKRYRRKLETARGPAQQALI